jgi:predicted CXXCH cytochrome family protein
MFVMMKWIFKRMLHGLVFALPLMIVTYAVVQASPGQQEEPADQLDCSSCHSSFVNTWMQSAHGQAGSNPIFQESWKAQGSPSQCLPCHTTGYDPKTNTYESDAITCDACHNMAQTNHPYEPMAADRSSRLCGECHQETQFEWQISAHRESGLDCVGCHDPHATGLKRDDPLAQCASCHRGRASNYAHSEHSNAGLTCTSCHLAELRDHTSEGFARLDHSFHVRLSTCNSCHAYQMHDPVDVHPEGTVPAPRDANAAVENLTVNAEPLPVSPIGFATLAGLFGLAAGVILGPYFERRYRNAQKKDE